MKETVVTAFCPWSLACIYDTRHTYDYNYKSTDYTCTKMHNRIRVADRGSSSIKQSHMKIHKIYQHKAYQQERAQRVADLPQARLTEFRGDTPTKYRRGTHNYWTAAL